MATHNGTDGIPPKHTPTQLRMLEVLSDGCPHPREELHRCLWDEESPLSTIQQHISQARKILRPKGEDIICELRGYQICYRHVRLLASAADGYR